MCIRDRIKPEAFQELFQSVVDSFYEKAELADWKGYQLFGIDGTRLNLPCTNEMCIRDRNCGEEDFAVACMRSNLRYGKNQKREDVKSHHYIISFDPRDGPDNGPVSYTHLLNLMKKSLTFRLWQNC